MILRAPALSRVGVEYDTVRLHAAIGYVTPMTSTPEEEKIRQAREKDSPEPTRPGERHVDQPAAREPHDAD